MLEEVRVYRLREASDITEVELSSRLKVSQNRVSLIEYSDIERGQLDTIRRYIEAVGGESRVEVEIGHERFLKA